MKRLFFIIFFISTITYGQNFSGVDVIAKSYPRYINPQKLADRIQQDFSSDQNRIRAAFIWLTNNIRYDLEKMYRTEKVIQFSFYSEEERLQKIQKIKDDLVNEAFLTKMGVCEEYAQSFKKLADLMSIEAEVLKGNVRSSSLDIGNVPNSTNHAWNSVKLNGKWILLDATWAAGYIFNGNWKKDYNEYFFDINPKKIGRTHHTDDRKWSVVLEQNTIGEFYNQPIYSQGFLKRNLELISPKKGILVINRTNSIVLKIKKLDKAQPVYFAFKGQRYSKKPVIFFEKDTAVITIDNPKKNTELYLFFNRELALEYKVLMQ